MGLAVSSLAPEIAAMGELVDELESLAPAVARYELLRRKVNRHLRREDQLTAVTSLRAYELEAIARGPGETGGA